jgi:hypothetical protein
MARRAVFSRARPPGGRSLQEPAVPRVVAAGSVVLSGCALSRADACCVSLCVASALQIDGTACSAPATLGSATPAARWPRRLRPALHGATEQLAGLPLGTRLQNKSHEPQNAPYDVAKRSARDRPNRPEPIVAPVKLRRIRIFFICEASGTANANSVSHPQEYFPCTPQAPSPPLSS